MIIREVEAMTDDELFFIAAYIEALNKKKTAEKNNHYRLKPVD
jgi:hypothetical protein